jgi:gliding motility-associated-like protein
MKNLKKQELRKILFPLGMSFLFTILISFNSFSQIVFSETFNEPAGSTTGNDNTGGVGWTATCPDCIDAGDWFEVTAGQMEGTDTNGPATFESGLIDISSCQFVEVSFDLSETGDMEACGTGCNSADWASFQYNIDGGGWQDPANSYFCGGGCAGLNVIADDDINTIAYNSGCLGSGTTLQIRISVQCWAASESWNIDNITVSCSTLDPTITPAGPFCDTDPSVNLTAATGGGTWTGTGIVNPATGQFNPAVAGVGVHNIQYSVGTAPCIATDNINITVIACPPCNIDNFTANIGACVGGVYETTGTVEFSNAPTTGQLIVEDCDGNQAIMNPPFTSPFNYTIPGQDPDGGPCDVTVYFTDDLACTNTIPYVAPTCACNIDNFIVNIGACNPTDGNYMLDGTVEFTDNPTTGTLIIQVDNGTTTYDTIINPPFVSPQTWSISGIPSDGANSTVTVFFSDNVGCSSTINYNAPTDCQCEAIAGTYTDNITGSTTTPYELCFGDQLDIVANGDYTPPQDFNIAGVTYDPGIWLMLYTCPPTVLPPGDINTDPCFFGIASASNGSWSIPNNIGNGTTLYYVPVTMYSMVDGFYAIAINGGDWCYDMGPVYEVTYLPEITSSFTDDCLAGTATITVNGGLPAVDGSNFTASNLLPATAIFGNTSAPDGGTITINGLQGGDMWSFDITDDNGCPHTVMGGPFPPLEDPGFSYPQASYCTTEPITNPTITGTGGGTFASVPAGLTINPATGQINPATSTPGTYDITYTTPGACFDDSTVSVSIAATPSVDPIADQTICDGDNFTPINFTGSVGSTFDWTNDNTNIGLGANGTGNIAAFAGTAPAVQEVANITVTPSAGACVGTPETFVLTVNPVDDATFNYSQTSWCTSEAPMTPTITGTAGGNFTSIPAGLSLNAATGEITPATSTPGTYDVTYTTAGVCPDAQTVSVTINDIPSVDPVADQTVCVGTNFTAVNFTGPVAGTTFDWTNDNTNIGLGAAGTGNIAAFTAATTGGSITGQVTITPSTVACAGTPITFNLTVNDLDDPGFDYPAGLTHCQTGTDPIANITGLNGGNFTFVAVAGGPTLDIDAATGNITLATSDIGTYNVTYNTAGAPGSLCPQTSTIQVVITDAPVADFTLDVYCLNDADPLPTFINGGAPGVFSSTPGLVINAATGQVDLDASTPGTYTVNNLIDIPGCAVATFDDDITINPLPNATIDGDTTICPTAGLPEFTIDITAGTGPWDITYSYNGTPNTVNTAASPLVIFPAAIGTYDIVSITDANGCTNNLNGQVAVDTFATPTVDALSDQSVCDGDQLQVQSFTGSPAGNTFDWTATNDLGFGLAGTGDIGSFTGVNGTGSAVTSTINVTPTSVNGCIGNTQSFTITVNPLPQVSFSDAASGCEPLIVEFVNTTPGNNASCTWDFGDGNVLTGCGAVSNTYSAGNYDVSLTVTSDLGCTATVTYLQYVAVSPQPDANFSYLPDEITVENTVVEFTNLSTDADYYEWDFGDGSGISNVESPPHLFPDDEPDVYTITLTAYDQASGCSDVHQAVINIKDVLIFYVPNTFTPDGDQFNEMFQPVFTSGYDPFDFHLMIFNRWGEVIFESYNADKGWNGHYGDGGLVQDGVYIWQIEFKENMSDKRHTARGHVTVLK